MKMWKYVLAGWEVAGWLWRWLTGTEDQKRPEDKNPLM